MPIIQKVGNLLEDTSVDVILQQCNIHICMGGGLALAIKNMYPEAYAADCETVSGDASKIGTYTKARCKRADGSDVVIVNVYSQTGMGAYAGNTSYDAIYKVFADIEEKISRANETLIKNKKRPLVVGIPYGYGSVLGGGRWPVIEAITQAIFGESPVDCYIIRLASQAADLK